MIDEATWNRFERTQARRERANLVRKGVVTPASRMTPQMMIKGPDGVWRPEIKTFN